MINHTVCDYSGLWEREATGGQDAQECEICGEFELEADFESLTPWGKLVCHACAMRRDSYDDAENAVFQRQLDGSFLEHCFEVDAQRRRRCRRTGLTR